VCLAGGRPALSHSAARVVFHLWVSRAGTLRVALDLSGFSFVDLRHPDADALSSGRSARPRTDRARTVEPNLDCHRVVAAANGANEHRKKIAAVPADLGRDRAPSFGASGTVESRGRAELVAHAAVS